MADLGWLGPPIDVRPLFAVQHDATISLLRRLSGDEWARPTACPGWTVKDVAAHLLGDHLGRLSMHRDAYFGLAPGPSESFPGFIDRINDEWVTAARRLSPSVLLGLLAPAGEEIIAFWRNADLTALGAQVSWAGPEDHPVWLDAARDFTEYWVHHQQICEAVGRRGIDDLLPVVVDVFLRALPHTLRDHPAAPGTSVQITIGETTWTCTRTTTRWRLDQPPTSPPTADLWLDPDTLWRLATRALTPTEAAIRSRPHGDLSLAEAALDLLSIIHPG